eukprot:1242371-Rhodomonas_salina.1
MIKRAASRCNCVHEPRLEEKGLSHCDMNGASWPRSLKGQHMQALSRSAQRSSHRKHPVTRGVLGVSFLPAPQRLTKHHQSQSLTAVYLEIDLRRYFSVADSGCVAR